MPKVVISGTEAEIKDGLWTSDNQDLTELLNNWTQNEMRSAGIDDPFFMLYSPSNPYPDLTIAKVATEAWGGEVIEEGEAPEYDPDVIY